MSSKIVENYHANGNLFESYVEVNGKIEGTYKSYFNNGNPSSIIKFKNGVYHGEYKTFKPDGTVLEELHFNYDFSNVDLKSLRLEKYNIENLNVWKVDYQKQRPKNKVNDWLTVVLPYVNNLIE